MYLTNHFNDKKLESEIVEFVKKTEIPCSIDYIAQHFKLAWGTARAILLNLAVLGKINAQKTTKSLIFWVEREEP